MEAKPARVSRWNGKCRRCKRHVSVGFVEGSRVHLMSNGMDPLFVKVENDYWPVRADCVMLDVDGFWRAAHGAGQSAMPCVVCCESKVVFQQVRGVFKKDHKCDARCLFAKGHDCECQCGGKNHGAGMSL